MQASPTIHRRLPKSAGQGRLTISYFAQRLLACESGDLAIQLACSDVDRGRLCDDMSAVESRKGMAPTGAVRLTSMGGLRARALALPRAPRTSWEASLCALTYFLSLALFAASFRDRFLLPST